VEGVWRGRPRSRGRANPFETFSLPLADFRRQIVRIDLRRIGRRLTRLIERDLEHIRPVGMRYAPSLLAGFGQAVKTINDVSKIDIMTDLMTDTIVVV
jgi:hypothetical protein